MKQKFNLAIQKELANEPEVMALLDKFDMIKEKSGKKYPIFSWNDCEDSNSENQTHKKADIAIFMNMSKAGKVYPTLTIEWKEEEKKW
jgi:hypothetical protein